jgi:hypothetical protein
MRDVKRPQKAEQAKCRTYEELVDLAQRRGYAAPERWAQQVMLGRELGALAKRAALTATGRRAMLQELRRR